MANSIHDDDEWGKPLRARGMNCKPVAAWFALAVIGGAFGFGVLLGSMFAR